MVDGISSELRKSLKGSGLDVEQAAMADLVSCGWSARDAWLVCLRKGSTWKDTALDDAVSALVGAEVFQRRVYQTGDVLKQAQLERFNEESEKSKRQEIKELTSKESLIESLVVARKSMRPGSREFIDATMKIADITQAKKETTDDEKTMIVYHLPLKCNTCSLKQAFDRRHACDPDEEEE